MRVRNLICALASVVSFLTAWPASPLDGHPPMLWEGIAVYRDLAYGPRPDAQGEGEGYTSEMTKRHPNGYPMNSHRTGQFFDLLADARGIRPDAPVYVHLHGGAWCQAFDKDGESLTYLRRFVQKGFVVVNANYLMPMDVLDGTRKLERTPGATYPAMMRDLDDLATYLKRDFLPAIGVRPTTFVLGGGSAGGHLATLYGYDQANPGWMNLNLRHDYPVGIVVDVVGPTDLASDDFTKPILKKDFSSMSMFNEWATDRLLTLLGWLTDEDLRARLQQGDAEGVRQTLARFSPNRMVNAKTPPTVMAYCRLWPWSDSDGCVPTSAYFDLKERLEKAGVPHRADLRSWRLHGWLRSGYEQWVVDNVSELLKE